MIKSMTGYGRGQAAGAAHEISCELKSVNHRFLDIVVRMPRRYTFLEERVKEKLKEFISRGRIEVNINIEKRDDLSRTIKVDKGLAIAYYNSLKDLAEKLKISVDFKLIDLFRLPDVFSLEDQEEDLELVWEILEESLNEAIQGLIEMRGREGQNLEKDIMTRIEYILSLALDLEQRSPKVAEEYQEKLRKRIADLLPDSIIDEGRLLQEAAIFADKSNVTEEIVRLKSHAAQLNGLFNQGDAIGRKCDFLIQEMFREINTIAAKANDLNMNQIVVEVKAELEKIREQVQNIE